MPGNQEVHLPAVINERLLEIPDYQRAYAWRRKQLEDLWEDLDLLGPTGSHYAGTLVLRNILMADRTPKTSQADNGATLQHCEVVDGQQRLITCLLLLDRVRRRLDVLASRGVENAAGISGYIRMTYGLVAIDNADTPRLKLGKELNAFWVDNVLGDQTFVGSALIGGQERLRDAVVFFDEKLHTLVAPDAVVELGRLNDLQRRITVGLSFLVYEVQSAAEVGVIFETLNERGRPLSDLEKTKNYLLYISRSITDGRADQLAELIDEAWADIFRNLAGEAMDADDQLLRAHWLATQRPDRREWKRIASIKRRFDRSLYISGNTRIVPVAKASKEQDDAWDQLFADLTSYVTSLRNCSFFLAEMFDTNAAFEAFTSHREQARARSGALYRSGVVAIYRPLLFAARLRHPKDGDLYTRLVDICERYSARVFIIRQRRANAGETRLLRLANDLYRGADPKGVLTAVAAVLWGYASDADVALTMQSTRENWYGRRGHKYFLYEYEMSINPHIHDLQPLSYFTDAAKEQSTTEHVLPQHPKAGAACWWNHFSKDQHAELVHSLGNLALTYDNSSYSNKCFDKKRGMPASPGEAEFKCYAQASLKQERLLAHYADWTPAVIQKRQKVLAAWALKHWSVPSPTAEQVVKVDVDIEHEGMEDDIDVDTAGGISSPQ